MRNYLLRRTWQGRIRIPGRTAHNCAWTEGIPILLPEVDEVAFVRGSKGTGRVPWERVMEVAADLIEPLDMYPKRFPSPKWMRKNNLAFWESIGWNSVVP